MSLRLRLTLLYTNLLGGVVLILGIVVYSIVSVVLVDQIDLTLQHTVQDVSSDLKIDSKGNLSIDLSSLHLTDNVFIQVWSLNGNLITSSQNIARLTTSIDPQGLRYSIPIYRYVQFDLSPMRVLTTPLVTSINNRQVGWLQVAINLSLLETSQRRC
jgi:two-component system OmpR family sensor kinase